MPLYGDDEIRKYIWMFAMVILVVVVFGGWMFMSIFVLPNVPEYGHQRVNFLVGVLSN